MRLLGSSARRSELCRLRPPDRFNDAGVGRLDPIKGGLARGRVMVRLVASAAAVEYRGIGLRIGRRSPEGKTERRAAAGRNAGAAPRRRRPKHPATSPL